MLLTIAKQNFTGSLKNDRPNTETVMGEEFTEWLSVQTESLDGGVLKSD
jgi:hypothetical protein